MTKIKWIKARKRYTLQTVAAKCLIPNKAKIMVARGEIIVLDLLEDTRGMVTIRVANPIGKTVEIIIMIMVMAVVGTLIIGSTLLGVIINIIRISATRGDQASTISHTITGIIRAKSLTTRNMVIVAITIGSKMVNKATGNKIIISEAMRKLLEKLEIITRSIDLRILKDRNLPLSVPLVSHSKMKRGRRWIVGQIVPKTLVVVKHALTKMVKEGSRIGIGALGKMNASSTIDLAVIALETLTDQVLAKREVKDLVVTTRVIKVIIVTVHLKILVAISKILNATVASLAAVKDNSAITAIKKMISMGHIDTNKEDSMDSITKDTNSKGNKVDLTRQIKEISRISKILIMDTEVVINKSNMREDSLHVKKMTTTIKAAMQDVKDLEAVSEIISDLTVINKMTKKAGSSIKTKTKAITSIEIKVIVALIMEMIKASQTSKVGETTIVVVISTNDKIQTISTTIAIKTDTRILKHHSVIQKNMS